MHGSCDKHGCTYIGELIDCGLFLLCPEHAGVRGRPAQLRTMEECRGCVALDAAETLDALMSAVSAALDAILSDERITWGDAEYADSGTLFSMVSRVYEMTLPPPKLRRFDMRGGR